MKYILKFFHLLVTRPMRTKYKTESVLLGMSRRMTWRLVKPKVVLIIDPNVVRPPYRIQSAIKYESNYYMSDT